MGSVLIAMPDEFKKILQLVQEKQDIEVTPLEELKGGRTGARLFLVSVKPASSKKIAHLILKLDHGSPKTKADESKRHRLALSQASPDFAKRHMAEIAFELTNEGCIAIFYAIAGQSLLNFHPLSSNERQNQSETIFQATNDVILNNWNSALSIEQSIRPPELLNRWLGYRLRPEGSIARFLEETCHIPQQTGGLLIGGELFQNPFAYGQTQERWDGARPIDIITGFQHGDLNTGNILVKFAANERDLEAYFLIDFALYKNQMPLLYDQRYLELSFLLRELERIPFQKWVSLVTQFAAQDIPNPRHVPVELTGSIGAINAGRQAFKKWIEKSYPSLSDDLWGQFWLAGAAAGLNFCNKMVISEHERLGGLIFSAAHLKRYCNKFGIPSAGDVAMLYDASQAQMIGQDPYNKRVQVLPVDPRRGRPTGTVTFLFTDIVGSTVLWEKHPQEMAKALALHDQLLEKVAYDYNGFVFKRVGDAFCVAFHSATDALEAAVAGQRALNAASWEETGPLTVRMGLHSGMTDERDGDYFGPVVNRVSRLHAVAHGGQILVSQATYELARDQISTEYKWFDLGPCPLKGLRRPDHVYQLAAPELPQDFPPLLGQDRYMSSLPEQATSFVGRQPEISRLISLLEKHRLVTLCGPGGIGKTRLAIATAEALQERYRHGVHFVPLLPLNSAMSIAPAIANSLGLLLLERRSPEKQLLDHLHAKQMLLVLDNMEHLLIGENSTFNAGETLALIESMLAAAPDLTLLITSRELLRLPQEKSYILEGLPLQQDVQYSGSPAEGAADLFLRRAQRIRPSFNQIKNEDLKQVNEICHLVEGMPLAIELAAAQLRLLSLGEILIDIKDNLDVFTSGLRGASTRHSSMRIVFESSWDGLTPREQLIFARLSVFRGGFTHQAAASVADAAVMDLATLLDKSLIRRNADGRFDMHALIHLFAAEKLADMPDQIDLTRNHHFHFYQELLHEAIVQWQNASVSTSVDTLIPEVENLRKGWRWILRQGDWNLTTAFLDDFWQFLKIQGRLTEAMELLNQARIAGQETDPPASVLQQAHWERLLGQVDLWLSKMDEGVVHFRQTLSLLGMPLPRRNAGLLTGTLVEIARQALHRIWPSFFIGRQTNKQEVMQESIFAYEKIAESSIVCGELTTSGYCIFRSLNQAESIGLRPLMARAYAETGIMAGLTPIHRVARTYLNWAENIAEEEPAPFVREMVSRTSGFYFTGVGQFEKAERHYQKAAQAAGELGQHWNQEMSWTGLLCLAYNMGEYDRSLAYARQIEVSARRRGDAGYKAAVLFWQALVMLRRGEDVGKVIELLQKAAFAPVEVMNSFDWIVVRGSLAQAYLRQGHEDLAIEEAQKVLRLVGNIANNSNIGSWYGFAEVVATYQVLWEKYYKSDKKVMFQESTRQIYREAKNYARVFVIAKPRFWLYQGLLDWLDGRTDKAQMNWQKSLACAQGVGMPFQQGLAHYEIGRHIVAGQGSKSGLTRQEHLDRAAEIFTKLGTLYELDRVRKEHDKTLQA